MSGLIIAATPETLGLDPDLCPQVWLVEHEGAAVEGARGAPWSVNPAASSSFQPLTELMAFGGASNSASSGRHHPSLPRILLPWK